MTDVYVAVALECHDVTYHVLDLEHWEQFNEETNNGKADCIAINEIMEEHELSDTRQFYDLVSLLKFLKANDMTVVNDTYFAQI